MKKFRYTGEWIIAFLKQVRNGVVVRDWFSKHGFIDAMLYK